MDPASLYLKKLLLHQKKRVREGEDKARKKTQCSENRGSGHWEWGRQEPGTDGSRPGEQPVWVPAAEEERRHGRGLRGREGPTTLLVLLTLLERAFAIL